MIGKEIYDFATDLWPLNRSITGDGTRETLKRISYHLPNLKIKSLPTNTKVFDWTIPREWKVNEAFIITPDGNKICDFSINNLHLLGYSVPFRGELSLSELKKHLHTHPNFPNAIPYVTSYYEERWGFCLSQNQLDNLKDGIYKVFIDTVLFDGELNYGELLLRGKTKKEIFLSTYICHPSMANNELSGLTVTTFLSKWLEKSQNLTYSYRIVFVPETIGSLAYLSLNLKKMKKNIIAGFNITCVGDNRAYSFLPSRNGNTLSDEVAKHILKWIDPNFKKYTWLERGSDERQYCAPGIDLPVASIMRTMYGEYPEYHSSLDDLENVVSSKGLDGGYWVIRKALEALEKNKKYKVTVLGEPQMGKRGLLPTLSSEYGLGDTELLMNLISLSDGENSLLEISEILNVPIWNLYELTEKLISHNLLKEIK